MDGRPEDREGEEVDAGLLSRPRRPWLGPQRPGLRRVARPVLQFLEVEAASGVALVAAATVAMLWANSPWQDAYEDLWSTVVSLDWGGFRLSEDLRHWVNDGLMVLFFFVVGLEIKDEFVNGELRDRRRAVLPIAAALGGMVVPGLVFVAVNLGNGEPGAWGVAVATDIAFALGVVALFGERIPHSARVFLLTLAIADDVGAVLVIAAFYTSDLSVPWLASAVLLLGVTVGLRWLRVWYLPVYVVLGVAVWLAVFESGVHATVAGVALGLLAPSRPLLSRAQAQRLTGGQPGEGSAVGEVRDLAFLVRESVPLTQRLRDDLHPWTSYLVIPLFALANAGVTLERRFVEEALGSPVTLGIVAALVVGKPAGILAGSWLARAAGGVLPEGTAWGHILGLSALAGIGFTMALFIAGLAFPDPGTFDEAKLGIFGASLVAAGLGAFVLHRASAEGTAGGQE